MPRRILISGNEAAGEGAIYAGCDAYYGYPITPQNEFTAYMSRRMPELGRVFVQAESELSAINMVYGSAAAGARTMTSSSSPGISLMQEGLSYLAASELPCVVVNVQRGGPGLGNLGPAQSDYWQSCRAGGHGDYRCFVLAPSSVQEMFDLVAYAFEFADKYRNPVVVLSDARIGQMMEPLELPEEPPPPPPPKPWALTGAQGRDPNVIKTLLLDEDVLEELNRRLQEKYRKTQELDVLYEELGTEDAEFVIVAYGTAARLAKEALSHNKRPRIGLLRPITLFPFPRARIVELASYVKAFISVEMSSGQMIDDIRLAVEGRKPIYLVNRMGGHVPSSTQILSAIREIA